jgi:hypothetical protein
MSTEHRFDPFGDELPERRQRSWLSTCFFGCLIMAVVCLLLAGVAAYWIAQHWRDWTASFLSEGINQAIDVAELPKQEREEIKVQVERVTDAFRNERISQEQLRVLIEELTESPILATIAVTVAEKKYLDPSGLSDEEKAEARITIQRFVRGAVDGTIQRDSIDLALQNIADWQENGSWRLRDRVSDADLRAFVAVAKTKADEANVPAEPVEFDPSDEIKRIVDKAMGQMLAEEPPDEEPSQVEPPTPNPPD